MLIEDKELPEIYFMKHRHDDDKDFVDYEKQILDKTLSPYMYQNDIMNGFLKRLQPLIASLFDQMNIARNFRNIVVDKYYYKYSK
jgi:hypothetical protein